MSISRYQRFQGVVNKANSPANSSQTAAACFPSFIISSCPTFRTAGPSLATASKPATIEALPMNSASWAQISFQWPPLITPLNQAAPLTIPSNGFALSRVPTIIPGLMNTVFSNPTSFIASPSSAFIFGYAKCEVVDVPAAEMRT